MAQFPVVVVPTAYAGLPQGAKLCVPIMYVLDVLSQDIHIFRLYKLRNWKTWDILAQNTLHPQATRLSQVHSNKEPISSQMGIPPTGPTRMTFSVTSLLSIHRWYYLVIALYSYLYHFAYFAINLCLQLPGFNPLCGRQGPCKEWCLSNIL